MPKVVVGERPNQVKLFLSGMLFGAIAFGIPIAVYIYRTGGL